MSSVLRFPLPRSGQAEARQPLLPWALVAGGFACMYLPVYWWAAHTIWQNEEHAHGALILIVVAWLFWRMRDRLLAPWVDRPSPWGVPVFALGLVLYVVGRAFQISIFEFGSQPVVAAGALLLLRGPRAVRIAGFALAYLLFSIPLPGILVDALTGPLKQWVSAVVVELLYRVGYPITRNGVMITVGQYQMLVADACSGLHSMFSLAALGTLFMAIVGRRSRLHSALMLASILPIAFVANVVRVIVLVLITYHFGDEAGQGFLHGAAGVVLLLVSIVGLFALDGLLGRLLPRRDAAAAAAGDASSAAAAVVEPAQAPPGERGNR